jgi:capsular polysaccharide biosynthesis protein
LGRIFLSKRLGRRYLYFGWSNPVKASNFGEPRIPMPLGWGVSNENIPSSHKTKNTHFPNNARVLGMISFNLRFMGNNPSGLSR